MRKQVFLRVLAAAILAGEPLADEIVGRCGRTLGRSWPWLGPMAKRYVGTFAGRTRPRTRDVVQFLLEDRGFTRAWSKYSSELLVASWIASPMVMQPVAAASHWDLPRIESIGALAEWLELSFGELDWLADLKGLGPKTSNTKLRHYHYRILAKQFASVRLIEAPKPKLKEVQKRILAGILDKIPTHSRAHGFVKGRSIKSYVITHVGRHVVLRMDLQSFFPSISGARIQAFFRTIGYPEPVADLLGGLCTTVAPRELWKDTPRDAERERMREASFLYSRPHLPQGAPTSPALANFCAYRVDSRLTGLAKSAGAEYTRYADDLAFSGGEDFERRVERFSTHVAVILMQEGFHVHHRKTRVMRQGVRQHLAGIVANRRLNVMRPDFDRLKATLTNCLRSGPATQNRESHPRFREHLEGRVRYVETINPAKGQRLRRIYEQIRW